MSRSKNVHLQPSELSARSNPRQRVACPFPHEELTVRPKITIRTEAGIAKTAAGIRNGFAPRKGAKRRRSALTLMVAHGAMFAAWLAANAITPALRNSLPTLSRASGRLMTIRRRERDEY